MAADMKTVLFTDENHAMEMITQEDDDLLQLC